VNPALIYLCREHKIVPRAAKLVGKIADTATSTVKDVDKYFKRYSFVII